MKISWFGVALVVVGAALLLDRIGYVSLEWHVVFWGFVALFGALKLASCFASKNGAGGRAAHGGVFWGTLFLLVGLANLLTDVDVLQVRSTYWFPILIGIVGVAFLVVFISRPREWHILIPALFFSGVSALLILGEAGMLDRWDVRDALGHYWPVALILFGTALLLNRRSADS